MKISFAGLGQMGKPIAKNLAKAGAEVIAPTASRTPFPISKRPASRRPRISPGSPKTDILFLCLPNTEVVHAFLLGESGLIERLRQGQTVVDLSTIGYTRHRRDRPSLWTRKASRSWTRRSPAWRRGPSRAR